jgi:uncharacterized protein YggE
MEHKTILLSVIIASLAYIAGQHIASEPLREGSRGLTVQATGKASFTPDIGYITLGVQIQPQTTSEQATDLLAKQVRAVVDVVKKLGVADEDIATRNLSVNPSYDYRDGKQVLRGYEASQQVEVTVRKTDGAGAIVAAATAAGANQVGGLSFKNDDPDRAQLAAEQDAIESANKKAAELAHALGVRLGKVKNYNVQPNYGGPMPYTLESKAMGGDNASVPPVPVGAQESTVTVTVTYDIR